MCETDEIRAGYSGNRGCTRVALLDEFVIDADIGRQSAEAGVRLQDPHRGMIGGDRKALDAADATGLADIFQILNAFVGKVGEQFRGSCSCSVVSSSLQAR